jgi:glyceraldehyde-3-phosphate dehydrogenase (NADP+)
MTLLDTIREGETYKMYIGGKWVLASDRKTQPVFTPIDGSQIGSVPSATEKDVDTVLKIAVKAKKEMGMMAAVDRAKILRDIGEKIYEYFDEFMDAIIKDAGKPRSVTKGEVTATAERFIYAAEEAKAIKGDSILGDTVPWHKEKIGMVLRQPVGVVLAISPFNYPLFIAAAKIAPALAAGNSVICKPASDDPLAVLLLAKIIEMTDLPKGVFSVITGRGHIVGDRLAQSNDVNMISFTGSSSVGHHIGKIAALQKIHLELGGKAPALVLEDADLDVAAKQCVSGAYKFSGQRCDAISRILVEKKVANKFVKKLLAEAKTWKMGDPFDEKTKIGPLINQAAIDNVDALVKDAIKKGAKVLLGGKKSKGLYYEPTVLDNVTPKMKIAWEETFGPVATIIRVKDYEEAIEIANKSEFGLDASVFTQDIDKAIDAGMRLEDGTVNINAAPAHGLGNFPFGGDKESGVDREGINFSVDEMTKIHTIVFNPKK